jgi:hypothetical protein
MVRSTRPASGNLEILDAQLHIMGRCRGSSGCASSRPGGIAPERRIQTDPFGLAHGPPAKDPADIPGRCGYISPARHVRAFGVELDDR